jgi:osmotically-inducible protein OsmY
MGRGLRSDDQIRQAVLARLRSTVRVDGDHIAVNVENGLCTLSGWLASPAKRWAAGEAAHRVPGVRVVLNDIVIPVLNPLPTALLDAAASTLSPPRQPSAETP